MPLSAIDNIGWYQLLSESPSQSANDAPAVNAAAEVTARVQEAGNTSTFSKNLHLFMQALYETISSVDSTSAHSPSAGGATSPDFNTPTYPTYSKKQTTSPSAQGYQQGKSVLYGRIGSLISALGQNGGANSSVSSSSGTGTGNLFDLQATFNRVLQDLEAINQRPSAADSATTDTFNVVSGEVSTLTLNRWLQGLRQSLLGNTTVFSSVGNLIDVVV